MSGFEGTSTETLTVIAGNLRRGLDVVADRIAAGTFHTVGAKGAAPPSQSGQVTLALLDGIQAELAHRNPDRPPNPEEPLMPGEIAPDTVLLCPHPAGCPDRFPVSEEDPDATLSELVVHLTNRHGHSLADAMNLLAQVREADPTGASR